MQMGKPQVTGISPKEGPPGTRVTIRGENLGSHGTDIIGLRICGVDCLLSAEWKSSTKIIARTGQAKGKGDIIVVTRSGGTGSSMVTFRGYNIQIGQLQESAVWIDETAMHAGMFGRSRAVSPSLTQMDDPLGISDEASDTRFPEEELQEMFKEGCGDTSQENFVPAWYLLQNHHATSFDDLKAGLAYLKRKSGQRNEGPMVFVKNNLSSFMDCYDSLTEMHGSIVNDQQKCLSGSVTQNVEDLLLKANKAAEFLFHDVLGRRDRADATRNALAVLHRFKWLFNLPHSIDNNINKGDYDLIITDFTRAKSLFGDTDVQVFKTVYEVVEQKIAAFREMLHKKLLELPLALDEQKKLIRYLVHLEYQGDPAWNCLVNMQNWLRNLLLDCNQQHHAKDQQDFGKRENLEDSGQDSITASISRHQSFKSGGRPPQKVLFVDHLTRLLLDTLPDLWRLSQAYFSGKLLKEMKSKVIDPSANQTQFKLMLQQLFELFTNLLRSAFVPHSLEALSIKDRVPFAKAWLDHGHSPSGWLPICVRYNRSCILSLSTLDLPSETMTLLLTLAFDMRAHCMKVMLKQAVEDIAALHDRETWIVDTDDEQGATTLLPALFENIVSEAIQHLNEIVKARTGEQELFNQPNIAAEATQLSCQLLQAFSDTLDKLAFKGNTESIEHIRTSSSTDTFSSGNGEQDMPPLDKRLIIMMGNCKHTCDEIVPRLIDSLDKHGYPSIDRVKEVVTKCYEHLDERLFTNYIEEKSNPIVGALEQNMYAGRFDWNRCRTPTGIRPYIKEAIMGLIAVHAEVYSISPNVVSRVILHMIEPVVDELVRLILCVNAFSNNGALQARLELLAFKEAVGQYNTQDIECIVNEGLQSLPACDSAREIRRLKELMDQFQKQMKFQLLCFQMHENPARIM